MAAQQDKNGFHDVIIIGSGMCGISCGAALKTFGIDDFLILEKGSSINNFWKNQTYDRMSLHTPYHDLPFDGGLVYHFPQMKNKHQITNYLQKYAEKYKLIPHITLHTEVIIISKQDTQWTIHTKNGKSYHSNYLCMATSALCVPTIPRSLRETMKNFKTNNGIVHSMQYKNGEKYQNENVLIVGNGDSAFEIAVDLVQYKAKKVTLISPMPRHVVRFKDLNKFLYKLFGFAKRLGIIDILMSNVFRLTPKHPKWNIDRIAYVFYELDRLSVDLTQYGIPKPKEKVFNCNVKGSLQVLDWEGQHSCVDLVVSGRIDCICDLVVRFDAPNRIQIKKDERVLKEYDSVILCTGYSHGLQKLFETGLFNELFAQSEVYKHWGIVPKTNGLNQSTVDKTLFFVGLLGDYSVLGGYGNGYWGWEVGRTIAREEGVYDRKKEPSTWNLYTVKRMTAFLLCVSSILGSASYYGYKVYKDKRIQPNI